MSVCVGCGLTTDNGPIEIKTRASGGVICDDSGIRVNLAESAVSSYVSTIEQTSSTTYTDLATIGPQLTLVTSTDVLITLDAEYRGVNTGNIARMSVAVGGASFIPASDIYSLRVGLNDISYQKGISFVLGGITPGINIFTAKYRAEIGTAEFAFRRLVILAIGTENA